MNIAPLDDIRVIELGHAVAGPFASSVLSDFGADVIKVEQPGAGDSLRNMGPQVAGAGIWWAVAGRNKRSIAIDFKTPHGLNILHQLIDSADVVVENFRPGVLDRAGLGWSVLHARNPRLVMLSISGFGQTGPYSSRPGFGKLAEAFSGATFLTGDEHKPPVHPGYSLADATAGLMGAYGVLLALRARDRTGVGQQVDLALYEPLLRMIEWQLPLFHVLGQEPKRQGPRFPFAEAFVTDICSTSDGGSIVVSAATTRSIEGLAEVLRAEGHLAPDITDSDGIVTALRSWACGMTQEEAIQVLRAHDVVAGGVATASDILTDEHVTQRRSIVTVPSSMGELPMPAALPALRGTPGSVRWSGPALGAHTTEVLRGLGLSSARIEQLRDDQIVA